MTLKFNKSQSSVYPELLDTTSSKTTVYIRQNVKEIQSTDEDTGETYTTYEYEEAKLTKEEYEQYLEETTVNQTLESIETLKSQFAAMSSAIVEGVNEV